MTAAEPPGFLVVGSTAAGSSAEELIETVAGALARTAPAEVAVTGSPEDLDACLPTLEGRTLVVVGGDGSAHVVVNALERCGLLGDATVGFVPLGTANDLATHLGMPADPREAVELLVAGAPRSIDLMRIERGPGTESELAVNVAHAGLGIVAAERATPLKGALGRYAYPLGVVAAGARFEGLEADVVVDGEPLELDGPVLAVAVANAPRLGGVELVSDARIDDGTLDVLAVAATPWSARLRALGALAGKRTSAVASAHGRVVEIRGGVDELDVDGESVDVSAGCRIEVLPSALTVLAPT